MENLQLVLDLVLAVLAAFVGGLVAQRLRQPVILGYLLAGVAIGPFTPGPTADVHSVQVLAEIGVAFLMFALGAEVSLRELRQFGRVTVLGGTYLLGTRAVPWLLGHAAGTRSREVFLLGIVSLALGTALATQAAGLSLAFGAFLAGLVVAESEYRTQVLAEVLPLRDLFASLFIVSVGMLINLPSLVTQAGVVLLLSATTIVGEAVIV